MGAQGRTVVREIARFAGRGHGVVARDELLRLGVTRRRISRRLANGSLIREFSGVYRVGHGAPLPQATTLTGRRVEGISTRRARRIDYRDRMTFEAIPTTTVPRTLVDIAAELDEDELALACHEAGVNTGPPPERSTRSSSDAPTRRVQVHNTRHAFEQDRRRERDVYERPAQMLAELRELLVR